MKIIVCVDDDYGMLFNNRRVSRDKALTEKIYEIAKDNKLWIGHFSEKLFETGVTVDDDMLEKAGKEDFCFVENMQTEAFKDRADEIYLFKWNRRYPADLYFDREILDAYYCAETEEFAGNSHEKITLERWTK
jgi:hypothetical protein